MSCRTLVAATAVLAVVVSPAGGVDFQAGGNAYSLRGQRQAIYYIPSAMPESAARPAVLFLPGDRGWAGKAIDMARAMATWGYDIYGFDTNTYLTSFTGRTTLSTEQVIGDLFEVANDIAPRRRVLLVGWSEGAGLTALAASSSSGKSKYAGVVVFGLSDKNVLAWRWKDELSILTQSAPDEPTFSVKDRLPDVSPTPFAMLRATGDQFVAAEEARVLYDAAREPKRYVEVEARNHRFDGNDEGFYRELKGAFDWALSNRR